MGDATRTRAIGFVLFSNSASTEFKYFQSSSPINDAGVFCDFALQIVGAFECSAVNFPRPDLRTFNFLKRTFIFCARPHEGARPTRAF
jgi:hypothetical protein